VRQESGCGWYHESDADDEILRTFSRGQPESVLAIVLSSVPVDGGVIVP
jgi:hypothetical protein